MEKLALNPEEDAKPGISAHRATDTTERLFRISDFRWYAFTGGIEAFPEGGEIPFRPGNVRQRAARRRVLPR